MRLYYDFHIHSALSPCADNDMTPCNIVNMACLKGLDAIAVTDHNSARNVKAAMKAGEKAGITVIAGMEIETCEEVHVLSLFPSAESAQKAETVVRENMQNIQNRSDIFGNQLVMDENDNILYEESQLLISATTLSIEEVFSLVRSFGGVPVAAHVDRSSFSVLTNLGFIPEDLGVTAIEVSCGAEYLENHPELKKYKLIKNSDAHSLGNISERVNSIEVFDKNIKEILYKFI